MVGGDGMTWAFEEAATCRGEERSALGFRCFVVVDISPRKMFGVKLWVWKENPWLFPDSAIRDFNVVTRRASTRYLRIYLGP